jgi:hypothetical protein
MRLNSPEGRPVPPGVAVVPRPASLAGLRIGLLDNTKAPVDEMLAHLAARLRERIDGVEVFHVSKQHPSLPVEPENLAALRANADVVINALGD